MGRHSATDGAPAHPIVADALASRAAGAAVHAPDRARTDGARADEARSDEAGADEARADGARPDGESANGWPGTPASEGGGLGWPGDIADAPTGERPAGPAGRRRGLCGLGRRWSSGRIRVA